MSLKTVMQKFLSQGLVDSYLCMHSGRIVHFDLHGWTWGFPAVKAPPTGQVGTPVANSKRKKADSPTQSQDVHPLPPL